MCKDPIHMVPNLHGHYVKLNSFKIDVAFTFLMLQNYTRINIENMVRINVIGNSTNSFHVNRSGTM